MRLGTLRDVRCLGVAQPRMQAGLMKRTEQVGSSRGAWVSSAETEVTHTGQERKQSDPPTRTTEGWRRWWGQGDYEKADGTSRVRGREKL